ncbi:unnamed protein product [Miscanthus lutarioriparius]|uniref:Nucleotide-diphospho-sugar transferase domain-containing protein n=1 Tax=Miscanthus lutarioriparius TaxID=422564 RepID=A0A811P0X0_9POAL|nr:unnamed protein product [Miscanthus lutarioriparius]
MAARPAEIVSLHAGRGRRVVCASATRSGTSACFADMTTSSDDANSLDDNWSNTGFYYVKATNRTVEMLRQWRAARRRFPPNHGQAIFNEIKHELAAALGVRIQFRPRHGAFRWLLPDLPQQHGRGVHHARQLLLRPR